MEEKRYRVRLVRPVFQVAVIEVDASSEEEAVAEAVYQADTVPEQAWSGSFDPESYFYDVHYVQDVAASEDDLDEVEDDRKYLLLRGDIDSGCGAMPFQPWLADVSDLMVADLCSDWGAEIAALEEVGVSSYFASLDRQVKLKHPAGGKVIPFRRPAKPTGDNDDG